MDKIETPTAGLTTAGAGHKRVVFVGDDSERIINSFDSQPDEREFSDNLQVAVRIPLQLQRRMRRCTNPKVTYSNRTRLMRLPAPPTSEFSRERNVP